MDFWSTPPRWTDDPNRPLVGSAALQEFVEDEGAPEDVEEVWFMQKAYEAEWAIESGGDIYVELHVPYTTSSEDMRWLLRQYIRQFHGDESNSWNMIEAEKAEWTSHAARVGSCKSYFENEVLRLHLRQGVA